LKNWKIERVEDGRQPYENSRLNESEILNLKLLLSGIKIISKVISDLAFLMVDWFTTTNHHEQKYPFFRTANIPSNNQINPKGDCL
jgi:hypothetical protein